MLYQFSLNVLHLLMLNICNFECSFFCTNNTFSLSNQVVKIDIINIYLNHFWCYTKIVFNITCNTIKPLRILPLMSLNDYRENTEKQ